AADDLEGRWALALALNLEVVDAHGGDDGFGPFARVATGRKYRVDPGENQGPHRQGRADVGGLYELTTGATALTESLALSRSFTPGNRIDQAEKRTIAVERIQGIDVAQHPWEEMMRQRKPADEPLAKLVPHDNYFFTVRRLDAFVDA